MKHEIPSKIIGEIVMKHLKTFDKVAYIRFASVYRKFSDIDNFKQELENLNSMNKDKLNKFIQAHFCELFSYLLS